MSKEIKREEPTWFGSRYRGSYDYEKKKRIILHEKPLRCPYCGTVMVFNIVSGYETHASDSYWICGTCYLRLGNRKEFSRETLDDIRHHWRRTLLKGMKESKDKYYYRKKQYETYGVNFTLKEKKERLVETIELHTKEEPL